MKISTAQQKVDKERYGDNYEKIFRKPTVIAGKDIMDPYVASMDAKRKVFSTVLFGFFSALAVGGLVAALVYFGVNVND